MRKCFSKRICGGYGGIFWSAGLIFCAMLILGELSGCTGDKSAEMELIPDSERIEIVYAADFEFAPFRVATDQGYFGYEIDVNAAIFSETRYKLNYVFRDLRIDNLEELAKSRDAHIFGWRVITPLTEKYMLLSDPVYEFNWGAVTLPDMGRLSEQDYKNYKIGIVHRKYPYSYLVAQLGLENVVEFSSYDAAAEALISGDIDIWFEEREISNYYLIQASHYASTEFHEETNIPVKVGLLIRPDLKELHAEVNRQIRKIKANNQLESFYMRHFQKHSSEYLHNERARTRNIVLFSVATALMSVCVVLYILILNRKNKRTSIELAKVNTSLLEAKEQFSAAVGATNDGILYFSERVGDLILSERFCEIIGVPYADSFTLPELKLIIRERISPKFRHKLEGLISAFESRGSGSFSEEVQTEGGGETRWVSFRIKFERHEDNWVAGGILSDISERKESEAKTLYFAHHDFLTGIYNRMYLMKLAEELIHAAQESGERLSFLYVDLDNFKRINDTYTHEKGDEALKAVVSAIDGLIPEGSVFARVGGDEFVLAIHERYNAEYLCDTILNEISKIRVNALKVGASIGIAVFPVDADTVEGMIVCADKASRHSKDTGKNRWSRYIPGEMPGDVPSED